MPGLAELRNLTRIMSVPHGFTLSIGGTLAGCIGQRGYPGLWSVWAFVAGAGIAFVSLAVASSGAASKGVTDPTLPYGAAVLNLVPVILVPIGVWVGTSIDADFWSFAASGLVCAGSYLIALTIWVEIATPAASPSDPELGA
ncbi:hypothetical protein [Marmoricola sp. URHB0036]|uniref:hypothetical protein n=1 Tax=Marmoricola sp. URHB0036 TaxID=1298863 RepID=UPI0012DE9589|nr:hypothetical protein [Marmoricola sp. URHB0036]